MGNTVAFAFDFQPAAHGTSAYGDEGQCESYDWQAVKKHSVRPGVGVERQVGRVRSEGFLWWGDP